MQQPDIVFIIFTTCVTTAVPLLLFIALNNWRLGVKIEMLKKLWSDSLSERDRLMALNHCMFDAVYETACKVNEDAVGALIERLGGDDPQIADLLEIIVGKTPKPVLPESDRMPEPSPDERPAL